MQVFVTICEKPDGSGRLDWFQDEAAAEANHSENLENLPQGTKCWIFATEVPRQNIQAWLDERIEVFQRKHKPVTRKTLQKAMALKALLSGLSNGPSVL